MINGEPFLTLYKTSAIEVEKNQNNMNCCAFVFVLFLSNHNTIGMQEILVSEHIWCPTENFNYRLIDGECFYYETVKKHSLLIAQENCAGKFPNGGKLFEPRNLIMNAIVLKVRLESCFSELSSPYFSCDYSAFHYLALA